MKYFAVVDVVLIPWCMAEYIHEEFRLFKEQ